MLTVVSRARRTGWLVFNAEARRGAEGHGGKNGLACDRLDAAGGSRGDRIRSCAWGLASLVPSHPVPWIA